MRRCWSGFRTPIEWYQNKLLSSHLQAVEVQNTTNKVTFAKSTSSHAFYYTCTNRALVQMLLVSFFDIPNQKSVKLEKLILSFSFRQPVVHFRQPNGHSGQFFSYTTLPIF